MGQIDWEEIDQTLSAATLARGVTAAIAGPAGGNGFTFGYNSLDGTVTGAHGWFVNLAGFIPTGSGPAVADGGASVRGCVKRVSSPNNIGFSPFLFACLQGSSPNVNDMAYMIGLSDADPYEIVLAKAPIVSGLRESDDDVVILRSSSSQYSMGDGLWHHIRLDAVVQPNGDVLLKCYDNNLTTNPIGGSFSWQAIAGMSDFIDDVLQINTGSAPLWGGRVGFVFACHEALNRRGAFDALQAARQAP